MFKKVLIGVDAARDGDRAAEAIELARAIAPGATYVLASVFPSTLTPGRTQVHDLDEPLRRETLDVLGTIARARGLTRMRLLAVPARSPGRGLRTLASEVGADLIVVGASRHAPAGRMVLGDVSRAVLRGAPCPVVVAPRGVGAPKHLARMAVAFDRSPEAEVALSCAVGLVHELHGSLVLADAIGVPHSPTVPGYPSETRAEDLRRGVEAALTDIVRVLPVPATAEVTLGEPIPILGELSRRVDLIVCGSRGWGPLARVMLGSTSDALIHHAHCAVLVIPKGPAPPASDPRWSHQDARRHARGERAARDGAELWGTTQHAAVPSRWPTRAAV
jgi:nucleotide-binding universal stress UspA family protein